MFPHSRAAVAVSLGSMVVGFTSAWSVGRVLAGLCIGVTSVSLPISLAEVLDPEVRGWVTGLYQGNLGALLCSEPCVLATIARSITPC